MSQVLVSEKVACELVTRQWPRAVAHGCEVEGHRLAELEVRLGDVALCPLAGTADLRRARRAGRGGGGCAHQPEEQRPENSSGTHVCRQYAIGAR